MILYLTYRCVRYLISKVMFWWITCQVSSIYVVDSHATSPSQVFAKALLGTVNRNTQIKGTKSGKRRVKQHLRSLASGADSVLPEPPGLWRKLRLTRASWPWMQAPSRPTPWPRTQLRLARALGLRRNLRPERAPASSAINASSEPRPRSQASSTRWSYPWRDVCHVSHAAAGRIGHYSNNSHHCGALPLSL